MSIRFRKYSWQLAPASIRDIRQQVFIEEQKVPPELEWDETDEIADHYLAVLPDNTPAGVARLFSTLEETGHIGRMAILPQYRGQGIGEALLRHLIAESADRFAELRLSAQEHAIPFYQRSGFHVCSGVYDDAGIPHFDMRSLAPGLAAEGLGSRDRPMILGSDTDSWLFDTEARLLGLMDSVVGQAGQRIWLYDRLLEHDLYDRHRFRELISALARRHRLLAVRPNELLLRTPPIPPGHLVYLLAERRELVMQQCVVAVVAVEVVVQRFLRVSRVMHLRLDRVSHHHIQDLLVLGQ